MSAPKVDLLAVLDDELIKARARGDAQGYMYLREASAAVVELIENTKKALNIADLATTLETTGRAAFLRRQLRLRIVAAVLDVLATICFISAVILFFLESKP